MEEALGAGGLNGVAICSPTSFHPDQTIAALRDRLPVLLEKPVAISLSDAERVMVAQQATGTPVVLGYCWRWWPPLERVRSLLAAGVIGAPRHVQFHMSAHLADWHPWEPYQEFFMSSRALGGGALLDESHWIDLMVRFHGMPREVLGRVAKLSDLEIDTDDTVDALCSYDSLQVSLHLDLYGRPHEKFIRLLGEDGTLVWSAEPNRIAYGHEWKQVWQEEVFTCERNDMFVAVAREFLDVIAGSEPSTCTLDDGARVMRIVEAIRASSAEGRVVELGAEAATP